MGPGAGRMVWMEPHVACPASSFGASSTAKSSVADHGGDLDEKSMKRASSTMGLQSLRSQGTAVAKNSILVHRNVAQVTKLLNLVVHHNKGPALQFRHVSYSSRIGLDNEVISMPRLFEAALILGSATFPSWKSMVPAESILNLESKPLLLTKSRNTPSAAGLLQMLPRHTKRTAKGLVSAAVDGVGAAIDALIADPDEKRVPGFERN
ncbi:hypothetical protein C1H46_042885 [Malus baccata]|uniref:Uncharacterized protein n=1 Tax=Malus baccata TaxID=106549 RepID=A0A540KBI6_MALBA|nr:hypothetical protein C1H46_042885 [Malus baccata]